MWVAISQNMKNNEIAISFKIKPSCWFQVNCMWGAPSMNSCNHFYLLWQHRQKCSSVSRGQLSFGHEVWPSWRIVLQSLTCHLLTHHISCDLRQLCFTSLSTIILFTHQWCVQFRQFNIKCNKRQTYWN